MKDYLRGPRDLQVDSRKHITIDMKVEIGRAEPILELKLVFLYATKLHLLCFHGNAREVE